MKLKRDFILDPSLVLYLPLYELDSDSFMSKDAYGHSCAVTGALWRPNGRWFDSIDDWINCGTLNAYTPTGGFSFEAWLKSDTGWGDHTASKIITDGYDALAINNTNGRVTFSVYNTTPTEFTVTYSTGLTVGIWYHLIGTFDFLDKLLRLYQNGVLVATGAVALTGTVVNSSAKNKAIGGVTGADRQIIGTVGEARIYDKTLTPVEVQRNFGATKWRYS